MKFGFPAWYLGLKTCPQGGKSRYAENSYQKMGPKKVIFIVLLMFLCINGINTLWDPRL